LAAQKAAGRHANLALCPTHGGLTRPAGDFANSIRCYSDPRYNRRALVEADIAHWKCIIGSGLRSQTDRRQATEVAIAADVLNRMLDLGRPEYVRTA
jgi:hypothetical protein